MSHVQIPCVVKHLVPQCSIVYFLFSYINDLAQTINSQLKTVLFLHGANAIISHPYIYCFKNCINYVFNNLKWPKGSKQTLNFDKMNFKEFCTNMTFVDLNTEQ